MYYCVDENTNKVSIIYQLIDILEDELLQLGYVKIDTIPKGDGQLYFTKENGFYYEKKIYLEDIKIELEKYPFTKNTVEDDISKYLAEKCEKINIQSFENNINEGIIDITIATDHETMSILKQYSQIEKEY